MAQHNQVRFWPAECDARHCCADEEGTATAGSRGLPGLGISPAASATSPPRQAPAHRFTPRMQFNSLGPAPLRRGAGPAPPLPSSPSPGQQGFGSRHSPERSGARSCFVSLRKSCAQGRASVACVHLVDDFLIHRHQVLLPFWLEPLGMG